ncbi:MAG TPA: DASS family sodium-coupled anion symporter [Anaerolineales bacterium]|nr:DASS family sodium-coupled anion symporter [Anaerolineales bacterium]
MQIKPHSLAQLSVFRQRILSSKGFTVVAILAMGLAGYLLAPADLSPGEYTAKITLRLDGQTHEIILPFTVGETTGEAIAREYPLGEWTATITAPDSVAVRTGEQIEYRVSVAGADGRPIEIEASQAVSVITGPGYEQIVPVVDRDADGLVFRMRVPFKANLTLGLLFAVAVIWLTEIVPLSAGSLLIPVFVVLAGIADVQSILAPFFHPIIVLFLAGFLLAEAMHRTGADRLIALAILRRAPRRKSLLMLTMMGLTAFLSLWMSNTASVAIIIPIAIAILDKLPAGNHAGFRRALILGCAYAGAVGGIGSAIGTPANILAMTFLNEFTQDNLTFTDWFAFGLPVVLIMVPLIWITLLVSYRVKPGEIDLEFDEVLEKPPARLDRGQVQLLLVFSAVLVLWLTEGWHGIPTAIVALAGVLVLFFLETIKKQDLNRVNWDALLTFGGGLAIGSILVLTGVSDWLALKLAGLGHLPAPLVIFLVAGFTLVTGAFISNTACAAMLIPLAIPLAQILGLDPRLLVAVVAIASSIDFALVIGTPPTMLAYSTGLFETKEIFRRGIVLDLYGVLVLSFIVVWIWRLLGIVVLV